MSFWEGQGFFSFLELDVMQRRREKFQALVVKGKEKKRGGGEKEIRPSKAKKRKRKGKEKQ